MTLNRGQTESWQREQYGTVLPANDGNSGAAYAPSVTSDTHQVLLTANCTVGAPVATVATPLAVGLTLLLVFTQDSTGSRTLAWNSIYRNAPSWSAGAAGTKASAAFRYDGAKWQFIGGSTAFA